MRKKSYLFLAMGLLCVSTLSAQVRREFLLEKGWKFTRTDDSLASGIAFDDRGWQSVTVPHDWAIYGPFDPNNDRQNVAIVQDGQVEPSEHAGRTGGLPFVGTGWYRTKFSVPEFAGKNGKRVTVQFDGAMSGAQVWINGRKAGEWPYGYNSFYFDVTPYLNADGKDNVLAVRLENLPESSRWYPGAGLYRNVHVIVNEGVHIPVWGTYVTTPVVNDRFAKVNLKTEVVLPEGFEPNRYRLVTEILDSAGRVATGVASKLGEYDESVFTQEMIVDDPALWDLDNPVLYTAVSKLYEGNDLRDEYSTRFGIRTIEIRPDDGFYLMAKRLFSKGCATTTTWGRWAVRSTMRRSVARCAS